MVKLILMKCGVMVGPLFDDCREDKFNDLANKCVSIPARVALGLVCGPQIAHNT